jgi:hypothetical protein
VWNPHVRSFFNLHPSSTSGDAHHRAETARCWRHCHAPSHPRHRGARPHHHAISLGRVRSYWPEEHAAAGHRASRPPASRIASPHGGGGPVPVVDWRRRRGGGPTPTGDWWRQRGGRLVLTVDWWRQWSGSLGSSPVEGRIHFIFFRGRLIESTGSTCDCVDKVGAIWPVHMRK